MAALLAIDRAVIEAMASPQTRSACAARLAALLARRRHHAGCPPVHLPSTPTNRHAGRGSSFGGAAEQARNVGDGPLGVGDDPRTGSRLPRCVRHLTTLDGQRLVGVIQSVAARKDADAVATLQRLADSPDKQVAAAAIWALGNIADDRAAAFLTDRAPTGRAFPRRRIWLCLCCDVPTLEQTLEKRDAAQAIYNMLSQAGQPAGVRRAALEGSLRLCGDQATATILAWFSDPDADRRRIAAGHLHTLPDEQLDRLLAQLPELPDTSKLAVMEAGCRTARQANAADGDVPDEERSAGTEAGRHSLPGDDRRRVGDSAAHRSVCRRRTSCPRRRRTPW